MSKPDLATVCTSLIERARRWYEGSLINRTALKSQLLVAVVLLAISVFTYLLVADQVSKSVNERLEAVASLNAQRLQSELDRVLGEVESLSGRSLVANGLADSAESNAYLRPHLYEYRRSIPELRSLFLVDAFGQIVASSDAFPILHSSTLALVTGKGQPVFRLEFLPGKATLHVAFPVNYEATRQTEGALVGEIDLIAMVRRAIRLNQMVDGLPHVVAVDDGSGQRVFSTNQRLDGDLLQAQLPIGGLIADRGISLVLTVSAAKTAAYQPLVKIGAVMFLAAILALLVIMVLTRKMTYSIIGPLGEMSRRAMEIAGAGPTGLRELRVTRGDEIGWMGTAFNEMVYSLRQAYATQEEQVQCRTEELAEARERLAGVLAGIDDVVYSIDPAYSRLEYISPAASQVFGYTPEYCLAHSTLLRELILPDDLAGLWEARRNLAQAKRMDIRYRIRRADGKIRWVQDRFHQVRDESGKPLRVSGLVRDVTATVEAEASLRLQERALASSSCGVVITDMLQPGQPILYVNEAFERITGYSAEEVLGKNCALLQGGKHEAQYGLEDIRQAIAHGRSTKVVIRNYRKDGEPFWNELQLSPLHDDSGRVTHYIGIQNDISPNIAATQALVDSEQRLALTIDALHEGVWDWNIPDDRLITSPSWSEILGLDPFLVASEPSFSTFARQLPNEWAQRVEDEIKANIAKSGNDFFMEHQMLHADGRKIWVANHARVVERAADGSPVRMVGTIVDITQRIESSQRIIGLMRQLDTIFTLSPDAFAYFDEAGVLSFVNPAFELMTGIQAGEVSELTLDGFHERVRANADPACAFPDGSALDSTDDQDGQLLYLLKPTRRILLLSRRSAGMGRSAVVYLRDVTRETEVDRMKSEFLSTAAHELRTPMASIMGFAELLMLREFSPERTKDMLGTMHRQACRLTDLINELLDLARIEARAGKDFKIARHRLEPVVRDAVAALHVDGDRSRMRLHLPEGLPEIDIDPAKMQQAVINLLSNAYKYSPDGGPIDISIQERQKNDLTQIGVVIRDYGIGMSPEQSARVFERFFRADPSGNIPGTGLGMSLVKEIMDTHGGEVEVDSVLGEGTCAALWLPVTGALNPVPPAPKDKERAASRDEPALWLNETLAPEADRRLH